MELDHIVPVAEGGTDGLDNLQWVCPSCHAEKSRREAARGISRRVARAGCMTSLLPAILA